MRQLIILTGPPGSGKTTYAATHFPDHKVFDTDLGNKDDWARGHTDRVLMTSAPSAQNKSFWLSKATLAGFHPTLVVMWVPRMIAYDRMKKRSGQDKTQRNDLEKSIERWYRYYSRHPLENRVG